MRYYVFTFGLEGAPIAMRLEKEGADVALAVIQDQKMTLSSIEQDKKLEDEEEKSRRLKGFDGLLKRKITADAALEELLAMPEADRSDVFIFFDFNNGFQYARQLAGKGFKGNFPTEEDRLFEVDRDKAKAFVKEHYPDILVAEAKEFKMIDEAKSFLEASQDAWVVKANSDAFSTFVPTAKDVEACREQVITCLDANKKDLESAGFILELKIMDPVEATPQAVFYDGRLVYVTLDLETKLLSDGDRGPMTGCSTDLILPISDQARIAEMAFPEEVQRLAGEHEGMFVWDISILFDRRDGKAYMGEFCPNRVGYNAFYTELEIAGGAETYFEKLVAGKNPMAGAAMAGASVRIFNVPSGDSPVLQVPTDRVITYDENAAEGLWLTEGVKEGDVLMSGGYTWNQAVMTGAGSDPGVAARQAFARLEGFAMEGAMYRTLHDYLTTEYPTSLLSRLKWLAEEGAFDEETVRA